METQRQAAAKPVNNENINTLVETVSEYSDKAVDASKDVVERSVKVAKEYPIHTAIGACLVGFLAGIIISKTLK